MGDTVRQCRIETAFAEQSVDQTGSKRVAAADTIVDFEPLHLWAYAELLAVVADRPPIVDGGGVSSTKRDCDEGELRVVVDHLLKGAPRTQRCRG